MLDDGIKSDLEIDRDNLEDAIAAALYAAPQMSHHHSEKVVKSLEKFFCELVKIAIRDSRMFDTNRRVG